ncbi:t-SNARE family protein [Dictyostelium discoideum AX4]|uniref:t-SNARE family protein n=1 Tax=Dictyostelium discoideum TaxID=44689 RepID=Q54ZH1_DICDI|nr:t-SNARE family protein [Dictyostelium discoideum AX4]EAL68745.2 t-SNARE family protein [Dictyostelium discoideum AX4]|eukprot:XP_642671.2 t-SNARE family protein [Dictyostelium discoideum AX4]
MVFKDRTSEFGNLAETLRRKQEQNGTISHKGKKQHSQKSQFSYAAAEISKGVFETSEKLIKLTNMAKNTKLFMDSSAQIEELTFIIKQDIQKLNKDLSSLDQYVKSSRQPNKQTGDHSETIVGFLNLKLSNATKDFKDILEVRTESLKQQQEKKDSFSGYSNTFSSPPGSSHEHPSGNNNSALYKYEMEDDDNSNEHSILMPQELMMHTTDYSSSRLRAAENISSTINQLEGIFTQLANLVSMQGEVIERIDSNMDDSLANISRGHDSLIQTLLNVSSNRSLILKIFLVLIVFIVIFVVFFA